MPQITRWIGVLALLVAGQAFAANYASCLLNNLPGVANAPATAAAISVCQQQHPEQYFVIKRGEGRGLLGYKSADQCTLAKAKSTPWLPAAGMIKRSCECLYGTSFGGTDMCERYQLPRDLREQHTVNSDADQLRLEHHYRRIYAAHPDADDLFLTRDFQRWWTSDKSRENTMLRGNTQAIIKLMSDFKSQAPMWQQGAAPANPGAATVGPWMKYQK